MKIRTRNSFKKGAKKVLKSVLFAVWLSLNTISGHSVNSERAQEYYHALFSEEKSKHVVTSIHSKARSAVYA